MKKIYRILAISLLIVISMTSRAQNDGVTFSLMPQMPYQNFFNPGIRVSYKGVVGLGISNVSFAAYNSGLKYGNIYSTDENGDMYIDGVKFVDGLKEQGNCLNSTFSIDLLNVGFRVKKLFFNIDWRIRMDEELLYSKDFVGFFFRGNGNYLGADNPIDFNVGMSLTAFSEIGVGVQYDINDRLTVGVRPKVLFGVLNASANNERTKIYTDPDDYSMTADVSLDIHAASIIKTNLYRISDVFDLANVFDFASNSLSDLIDIKENVGFGIDFGASYLINRHFGVAAGVRDLGFIKWRNSKTKAKNVDNTVLNEGIVDEIEDVFEFKLDYNTMLDEVVKNVWGNDSLTDGDDYVTNLNSNVNIQGYYELNPMLRITLLGQLKFAKNDKWPSLTLAYSGSFARFLNLTASYTVSKYSGNALGAGVAFHFGPVNIYAVTDNIMLLSKIGKSTVEMATSYNSANVRCGVVITIGNYQKISDRLGK